jgi:hypothetical protein
MYHSGKNIPGFKRMKYPFLFVLTVCFLISSCNKATTKTSTIPDSSQGGVASGSDTMAVIEKPAVPDFQPVPSTLNVPLTIRTDVAQKMINEQLNGVLYETDTMTIANIKPVKLKVWKKDSITISLKGDELLYRVPLKIWMQFSFTVGALGLNHTEYQDIEASIALTFRSRIFVKNNWKIVTMTKSEGYEWLSDPVVKVRIISIPVKPVADFILSRQKASFGEMIDKAVADLLDVKKMISPVWYKMQNPILIVSDPDSLWLRLKPQGIYMTQLEGNDGAIKGSIGIKSVAETFFGTQPPAQAQDSLPEFVIPGQVDSSFVLNLYNELSYESASQITRKLLVGQSFSSGKYEAIINDVNIYGMDGYAVVSVDLSGYYKGKIYVIGKVIYDSLNQSISIQDLEFDLNTKNRLVKTANALFHSTILSKLQPYLTYPLKQTVLESQLMTQKMLSNKEISKNVFINGRLDSLNIAGINCTDAGIRTSLLAKGVLTLQIRE